MDKKGQRIKRWRREDDSAAIWTEPSSVFFQSAILGLVHKSLDLAGTEYSASYINIYTYILLGRWKRPTFWTTKGPLLKLMFCSSLWCLSLNFCFATTWSLGESSDTRTAAEHGQSWRRSTIFHCASPRPSPSSPAAGVSPRYPDEEILTSKIDLLSETDMP